MISSSTAQPIGLVSVIVPTFNRAHLVRRAVDSVLAQTRPELEVIVVDDCSTDDTPQIVGVYRDPRVRYLRRSTKTTAGATRNAGIAMARGDLLCFLDDDDEFLPEYAAAMVAAFDAAQPDVGFGWCGLVTVRDTPDGEETLRRHVWTPRFGSREEAFRSFLRSHRIGAGGGLAVRRSAVDVVGAFDETLAKVEDNDFFIRLARQFDFLVVPTILAKVHLHGGPRLTSNDSRMATAYEQILAKHYAAIQEVPATLAYHHYKLGWAQFHAGNPRRGLRHLRSAVAARPADPKLWAALFLFAVFGRWTAMTYVALANARTTVRHRVASHSGASVAG